MSDESLHGRWVEIGDLEVDVNGLESLIGEPISAIVPIEGGSINRVARIELQGGTALILRIAPSYDEAFDEPTWLTHEKLAEEQRTLQRLAKVKSIGKLLPRTIHFEDSLAFDVGDMVIQTFVSGQSAASVLPSMTAAERLDFYRQLGEMTRDLHSVSSKWFGPSWSGDRLPTWSALVLSDCKGFLEDADAMDLPEAEFEELMQLVADNGAELEAIPSAFIHSDLSMEHVFIEQKSNQWKISGLIDLEFARFADPVSEGLLLEMLQCSDQDSAAFFAGYGSDFEASEIRIDIAKRLLAAWNITDKARLARE